MREGAAFRCPVCNAEPAKPCTRVGLGGRQVLLSFHPSRVALSTLCVEHGADLGAACVPGGMMVCPGRLNAPGAALIVAENYRIMEETREQQSQRDPVGR